MQQFQPPGHYVASRPPKWLWLLPVLSFGLLAFVSPIAIATKARTASAWWWAGGLSAVWLVGFVLAGSDVGGGLYLGALIACVVYALVMGPKVVWPTKVTYVPLGPPPPPAYDTNVAAVALVQASRQKRHEARALTARDPQMARDLRIGRPDLERQYDDGGLVDANSASAETLAQWLGLSTAESAMVVEARTQLGRFEQVDDLVNFAGLEPSTFDRVSDRIIVM